MSLSDRPGAATGVGLDILARTLLGEAERADEADAVAIAWVVRNRCALGNWPDSLAAVCLQPRQFSCWNENDPGRARILAADEADPWFRRCREIARAVMAGALADPTRRATHYYATWLKRPPRWARGHEPVYATPWGRYEHLFFNDIDTAAPASAREALDQERPLGESRTLKGVGLAAGGSAAVVAMVLDAWKRVEAALGESTPWLAAAAAAAFLGLAVVLWARLDDRRQGRR